MRTEGSDNGLRMNRLPGLMQLGLVQHEAPPADRSEVVMQQVRSGSGSEEPQQEPEVTGSPSAGVTQTTSISLQPMMSESIPSDHGSSSVKETLADEVLTVERRRGRKEVFSHELSPCHQASLRARRARKNGKN